MNRTTFVVQTHNLWGDRWAAERKDSLTDLYSLRAPDLLAVQELRPWSRSVIDECLAGHSRVHDDFGGWAQQSNLWWRSEMFELLAHGAVDVGILDTDARLFWVRLGVTSDPDRTLIFSTAHLTWPGHVTEVATGANLRTPQAQRIVAELATLADDTEPVIFTVDINDIGGPNWAFGNGGFLDSFSALGRHSPPTHPVIPSGFDTGVGTGKSPLASPPKAIDWILLRGSLEPRSSEVVEFFSRSVAPSDHYPVAATVTLVPAFGPG